MKDDAIGFLKVITIVSFPISAFLGSLIWVIRWIST